MPINRLVDKNAVVHLCNGILIGHKNQKICDSKDGPRGYYAQCNKLARERQILYDFTYMWNLKNKINEQN